VTTVQVIAVGFLVLMVILILRGIRGHRKGGDGSGNDHGPGPDGSVDNYGMGPGGD
jgi:hypothetical protein